MLRDVARDFARTRLWPRTRLGPFAAERNREEKFPAEAVAELGKLGFMGMLVPEEYGGAGADHVGYGLVMEEIAAGEARSRRYSACRTRSAACRRGNTARTSRSDGFSSRWRRARCSRVSA